MFNSNFCQRPYPLEIIRNTIYFRWLNFSPVSYTINTILVLMIDYYNHLSASAHWPGDWFVLFVAIIDFMAHQRFPPNFRLLSSIAGLYTYARGWSRIVDSNHTNWRLEDVSVASCTQYYPLSSSVHSLSSLRKPLTAYRENCRRWLHG